MTPSRVFGVGLMSGTSCDGIDAALVEIRVKEGRPRVRTLAAHTTPYPAALRARLLAMPHVDALEVAALDAALGERLAGAALDVIRRGGKRQSDVAFVASHGHTAAHLPARGGGGATLQIGQPAVIAERTGIHVVADFRPRDVAAGGEGAPLVPFADLLLLAAEGKVVAAQNVGGIANVTALGPRASDVLAFDTGPGMMAIDLAVAHATGGRRRFDAGGRLARAGTVDRRRLSDLLAHPYLRRAPPKTTGREEFGASFVAPCLYRARTPRAKRDLVATLTAFTAASILVAYDAFLAPVDEVVVTGGGARNRALMDALRRGLAERGRGVVVPAADRGVDPDFKEAIAFALLGWAFLAGRPNTVPAATGARRATVAGAFWPAGPRAAKV